MFREIYVYVRRQRTPVKVTTSHLALHHTGARGFVLPQKRSVTFKQASHIRGQLLKYGFKHHSLTKQS